MNPRETAERLDAGRHSKTDGVIDPDWRNLAGKEHQGDKSQVGRVNQVKESE